MQVVQLVPIRRRKNRLRWESYRKKLQKATPGSCRGASGGPLLPELKQLRFTIGVEADAHRQGHCGRPFRRI
jgi:hypothetical protein